VGELRVIEARGVSKHFGRRNVLSSLDLRVNDGEVVALMGPNGAGKTTLLRILASLVEPSSGDVILDGNTIYDDPILARRSIGVVGHSTYTYDDLTALENLKFYWSMNDLPGRGFEEAGPAMLRRVGLAHRMNDRAAFFSRGMRQRLAIARALVHSPKVLLLDEPFSSLDQKGVEVLSQILVEERSKGSSVLVVTHDMQRIAALADRAVILVGGRMTLSFDSGAIKRGELEASYRSSTEGGIM
jgi:heme ABC exporter ATP-binding subunit CcmA